MPSDPADQVSKTGHPRLWVAGLVLLALVAGAFLLLLRDDSVEVPLPPPQGQDGSGDGGTTRDSAATDLLADLTRSLSEGTRRETVALAAPGDQRAARALGAIYDNVSDLGITDLSIRYVDENAGLGANGWVADAELAWRIGGFETRTSEMEVSLTLVDTRAGAAFLDAGGTYGNRAPLWLLDDLAVEQSRNALVMTADQSEAERFLALADQAVADVRKVLPKWRGRLVVAVPESQEQLNQTVAAEENDYDSIAAITATADGSLDPTSPAHILVNPTVFGKLGPDGAQIVMSHEATHVATNAATSSMPMWLLEGFGDYVALAHVDLPVSVTASQILADVRKDGPPSRLPGGRDFDPANKDIGAAYESAWLAARYLAQEYGEKRLIAFYRAVDGGASTASAFADVLGTDQQRFTEGWKRYLRQLST